MDLAVFSVVLIFGKGSIPHSEEISITSRHRGVHKGVSSIYQFTATDRGGGVTVQNRGALVETFFTVTALAFGFGGVRFVVQLVFGGCGGVKRGGGNNPSS